MTKKYLLAMMICTPALAQATPWSSMTYPAQVVEMLPSGYYVRSHSGELVYVRQDQSVWRYGQPVNPTFLNPGEEVNIRIPAGEGTVCVRPDDVVVLNSMAGVTQVPYDSFQLANQPWPIGANYPTSPTYTPRLSLGNLNLTMNGTDPFASSPPYYSQNAYSQNNYSQNNYPQNAYSQNAYQGYGYASPRLNLNLGQFNLSWGQPNSYQSNPYYSFGSAAPVYTTQNNYQPAAFLVNAYQPTPVYRPSYYVYQAPQLRQLSNWSQSMSRPAQVYQRPQSRQLNNWNQSVSRSYQYPQRVQRQVYQMPKLPKARGWTQSVPRAAQPVYRYQPAPVVQRQVYRNLQIRQAQPWSNNVYAAPVRNQEGHREKESQRAQGHQGEGREHQGGEERGRGHGHGRD